MAELDTELEPMAAETGDADLPAGPLITEDMNDAVHQCAEWLVDDKAAKTPILAEWAEIEKLRRNAHWDLIGPSGYALRSPAEQRLHPNSVENVTFSLVEGQVAEFCQDMELIDVPVEEGDDQAATLFTDLKKVIANKNRLDVERLDFNRNFFWLGTGIWEHVFDPDWRGGRGPNRWVGEVRWRSLDPYHAYPDARCRKDIHEGNRFHKASYVTLEYLRERYPEFGAMVLSEALDLADDFQDDLAEGDDEGAAEASTKDMTLLVETWYIGKPLILEPGEEDLGTGLHVIWWAGESQRQYLRHANYVYCEPDSTPKFPFTLRWRYPRRGSVFGYGEAFYLKQMNVMLNKNAEITMEAHAHQAFGVTYVEPGGLSEKQQKEIEEYGNLAGSHLFVEDINKIRRVYGNGVPASVQNEIERIRRSMEAQVGRFDVSQGRTPGSITAFRALDLLAQRAKVRLISADVALRTAFEDCGQYVNDLITENYTEARAYRVAGRSPDEPAKRGVFRLSDVQKVHFPATGTVVPFKDWARPKGAVEGQDYEVYTPELDVICKTTTAMPSDRMFFMEMGKELFMAKVIGPETLLYIIDKGKFPPIEQLIREQQAMQAQGAMPGAAPSGGAPGNLGALTSKLPPDLIQQLSELPPEEQEALLEQVLQRMSSPPALAG